VRPLNAQAAVAAAAVNSPDRAIPETNSWASPESPIGTQKNTRQLALTGESERFRSRFCRRSLRK